MGVVVYDVRDSRYAEEAHERHTVVAMVLETETDGAGSTVVQARWPVAAGERSGSLLLTTEAKVGERIEIWVDKDGNPVAPPTPTWHALDGEPVILPAPGSSGTAQERMEGRVDGAQCEDWFFCTKDVAVEPIDRKSHQFGVVGPMAPHWRYCCLWVSR